MSDQDNDPYGGHPTYAPPADGRPQPVPGLPPGVEAGGLGDRLLARVIDGLIVFALFLGVTLFGHLAGSAAILALAYPVCLVGGIAYEIVLTANRGATIGKSTMNLRVVKQTDGAVPDGVTAAGRYFSLLLMLTAGAVLFLVGAIVVALSPLFDKAGRRQSWWDKAAKTVVVKSAA